MQTRNKKYSLNSITPKLVEKNKGECQKLSESALKNLENQENLQSRSALQSKENHLTGKVTSFRGKISNVEVKLEKRSALKSKENNLNENSSKFSERENYCSTLQSRGTSVKNGENKENLCVNNLSKRKGKENIELTKRTIPLRRKENFVPEVKGTLSRIGNVKETKFEEKSSLLIKDEANRKASESKILRLKSESELNKQDQGLRVRTTPKINNLLSKEIKLPAKLTESQPSNLKRNSTQSNIDDQIIVLMKDVNKTKEILDSLSESMGTKSDENSPVTSKGETLPKRAPSARIRSRKTNSKGNTQEDNVYDKTICVSQTVSKRKAQEFGKESTEAKHEKTTGLNKSDTFPKRASVRIRSRKANSEDSLQENNLDKTTGLNENLGIVNKFTNSEIESTEIKYNEKTHGMNKDDTLSKRTPSVRIRSKRVNSDSSQESNLKTADSNKYISKINKVPDLEKDGKTPVLNKSDTLLKRTQSARIRSKKANPGCSSQQNLHNSKASFSNKDLNKTSKTSNKSSSVVKSGILSIRTPSARIRSKNTNSEKKNSEKKSLSNQPRLQVKTPVWKCKEVKKNAESNSPLFDFKSRRKSNRVSLSRNKDVYEFPFEGNEKFVIKKKRRRQQIRKKLKPLKKGLLTTDPLFQPTIPSLTTKAFYSSKIAKLSSGRSCNLKDKKNSQNVNANLTEVEKNLKIGNSNFDANKETPNDGNFNFDEEYLSIDDVSIDDAGYEASISVANDTEFSCMSLINPVTSVLPTPKITSRFPGPSSTPIVYDERYELNSFMKSKNIASAPQEEVKLCFGFDESDNEDTSIGLSPVKKIDQLSLLHQASLLTSSNVEEIDPVPTRFTFTKGCSTLPSFKKPLPLVNSKKNYAKPNLKKRCTSTKINHAKRRKLDKNSFVPDSLPEIVQKRNVSVLFDNENEETPFNPNTNVPDKDSLPVKAEESNVSILFDFEDKASVESKSNFLPDKYSLPLKTQEYNTSILFDTENKETHLDSNTNDTSNQKRKVLKCVQHSSILTPEKSFSKPPRKSYDRSSLEAVRRKFIEDFAGGYPTTDTDTEHEDPEPPYVRKRKKRIESQKENSADDNCSESQTSSKRCNKNKSKEKEIEEPNVLSNTQVNKKDIRRGKRTKKNNKNEDDWLSDINSHFSEIEEMDLVIE